MPRTVNIHRAKTEFSKLVRQALEGDEIVVARAGRPLVRLVPVSRPRQPGMFQGAVKVKGRIDRPLSARELKELGLG